MSSASRMGPRSAPHFSHLRLYQPGFSVFLTMASSPHSGQVYAVACALPPYPYMILDRSVRPSTLSLCCFMFCFRRLSMISALS